MVCLHESSDMLNFSHTFGFIDRALALKCDKSDSFWHKLVLLSEGKRWLFHPPLSYLISNHMINYLEHCTKNAPLCLRQVCSSVSLSREASGRPLVETVPGEEALALQEADSGVIRLRAGDPFDAEMSALWLGVQSLGFTLVCESHENLLLAEGTLRNLTRHCLEHLHMLGQGSEVRTRLCTQRNTSCSCTLIHC